MEEIIIDIGPNGDVTVEGVGISGPECLQLTKAIEDALGTVTKVVKKPEFLRTVPLKRSAGR